LPPRQRNQYITDPDGSTRLVVTRADGRQFIALIDLADLPAVSQHSWFASTKQSDIKKYGRVYFHAHVRQTDGSRKTVPLHRFVFGDPDGMVVNHRDPNNVFDNRHSNLRVTNKTGNSRNRRKLAPAFSSYKGVSIDRRKDCLVVRIRTDEGRTYESGFPITPEGEIAAARRYDELALEYHGEFAQLNFPRSDYAQRLAA
jgi:hypothetical protein